MPGSWERARWLHQVLGQDQTAQDPLQGHVQVRGDPHAFAAVRVHAPLGPGAVAFLKSFNEM